MEIFSEVRSCSFYYNLKTKLDFHSQFLNCAMLRVTDANNLFSDPSKFLIYICEVMDFLISSERIGQQLTPPCQMCHCTPVFPGSVHRWFDNLLIKTQYIHDFVNDFLFLFLCLFFFFEQKKTIDN